MEQLLKFLFTINIWAVAKFVVLLGLGVYIIFAFVVVRQVKIMTEVISGMLTGPLRLISWLFFLFSIAVWMFIFTFL